ncbi:putative protein phosphatase 2C 6-like [Capsicum annuum]|nr:putative protein phosphatase 2C 6-like [Capsicum annuum]KAF3670741.1 putative protein phosphatase 2C 6-like [Capsicum annuum]
MDNRFSLNVSYTKMKRVNRIILENMEGRFINDFNKLESYAQELRDTNFGSDVVVNISKDALEQEEFEDQLKRMGSVSEQVVKDMLWYSPKHWFRAYFYTECKNFTCENNFTESFNKWILAIRAKPIIKMLEDIKIKCMRSQSKDMSSDEVIKVNEELREGLWGDLGIGSSALAIGIARSLGSKGRVIATDLSLVSTIVASYNEKVHVKQGSWFELLRDDEREFVGQVSNLPYIPSKDIGGLQAEVGKHEPRPVLDGG